MELSSKEKQVLGNLTKALRSRFRAEGIILYGSAVRGELDEGSDIDLLIILPELDWQIEKDIIRICFDAELECGRVFSAVCYSTDEIENSPLKESPLVLNVRKQGRVL